MIIEKIVATDATLAKSVIVRNHVIILVLRERSGLDTLLAKVSRHLLNNVVSALDVLVNDSLVEKRITVTIDDQGASVSAVNLIAPHNAVHNRIDMFVKITRDRVNQVGAPV
jgi:hypothetical protein